MFYSPPSYSLVSLILPFLQLKPGLSAYAKDPKAAANSLQPLLEKAEAVVPQELRSKTVVRVGVSDLYGNTKQ